MATDEERETGLPAGIEAAWGLRERPGKGPKRALTLRGIVEAALRVGSAEGLQSVSMSKVAAELGASTMALYRYVASKDELLTLVMDAVIGPPPEMPRPGEAWRAGLSTWAWEMRAVLQRYPWVLRVPISGAPLTPNNVRWMEAALRCMRGTGLGPGAKVQILLLLSGFVRNEVMLMTDLTSAWESSAEAAEMQRGYGRLLARLTDARSFPELHEAIEAGVFEDDGDDLDADFAFGLSCLLDGVEALVRGRGQSPPEG